MNHNILMPIMIFMTKSYHSSLPGKNFRVQNILNFLVPAVFAGMIFFILSCEDDPAKIGRKILPGSDFVNIHSTDTVTVKSFTMYGDAVESDNPSTSYLGQLYDPYFGTVTAEFVSQIRLGARWDNEYFEIDSIKLYLDFLNVTGAVDKPQYLSFWEIDKQIYTDSTYYSNQYVPLTGFKVADILLPKLKADTINSIEIDIPIAFGDYLTRDTSMLFHHEIGRAHV